MMIAGIETERADLFDVSILISMRIHIKGRVNESGIRKAFDNAVNSHGLREKDQGLIHNESHKT